MRLRCSSPSAVRVLLVIPFAACGGCGEGKYTPIPIEREWRGEVPIEVRKEAPNSSYVTDAETWSRLWRAFRGEEPVPGVDFGREVVVIAVGKDPNSISVVPEADKWGNVRISITVTSLGYNDPKTCKYHFVVMDRRGIRGIKSHGIGTD